MPRELASRSSCCAFGGERVSGQDRGKLWKVDSRATFRPSRLSEARERQFNFEVLQGQDWHSHRSAKTPFNIDPPDPAQTAIVSIW